MSETSPLCSPKLHVFAPNFSKSGNIVKCYYNKKIAVLHFNIF